MITGSKAFDLNILINDKYNVPGLRTFGLDRIDLRGAYGKYA